MENIKSIVNKVKERVQDSETQKKIYRFDVFKGKHDADGKVTKLKSIGSAFVYEGSNTYNLRLKTFLKDEFFLLPERKEGSEHDYVILTREPSLMSGRKYFWNNVGEANLLKNNNSGLMQLSWDVFGTQNIYMNLYPKDGSQSVNSPENQVA